jgi:hypothetical protein
MSRKSQNIPIEFEENQDGCFVCVSHKPTSHGYYAISINKVRKLMHRHVYEEMYGPIPIDFVVRHKCDNRSCINPEHLELGTQLDNIRDAVERGRTPKGEGHWQAKLTENDVREIKMLISKGVRNLDIAKMYNIGKDSISNIKREKNWRHIQ